MSRRPTKREVERWLEQRDNDTPDGLEVTITDTVVESDWEPPEGEANDVPEPGTETTRVTWDERSV